MRYLALIVLMLLSTVSVGHAAIISNWETFISINADGTSEWRAVQEFNETVTTAGYFAFVEGRDIQVIADQKAIDCAVSYIVGTTISCTDKDDFKKIEYHFTTGRVTNKLQTINIFQNSFSVTQLSDRFGVTIQLPLFNAIVEKSKLTNTGILPFKPAFGRQTTDGRRIAVEWILSNPVLGTTLDTSVAFEEVSQTQDVSFFGVVVGVVVVLALGGFLFLQKSRIKHILPILTENERKVVEIVMRNKKVDQRTVVRETDYSKAKVSRVIQDLINRGVLEKERKGRTNILALRKAKLGEKSSKTPEELNSDKNRNK